VGYLALHERAGLQAGEQLVVRGGATAVGTAAIQLGVAAGAKVIAVAGGPEKVELCRTVGAAEVIDQTSEDVFDAVMTITDGHGADVVFDPIGGDQTETMWTCMALGGRYLAVGFNDDPESGLTGRPLRKVSMGNLSVLGVILAYLDVPTEFRKFGVNPFPPTTGVRVHEALCQLVTRGAIRPVIGRRIGLGEVAAALEDHEARRTSGRTVVDLSRPRAGPSARPAPPGSAPGRLPTRTGASCAMGAFDTDELLAAAHRQTGLDDSGDPAFREGLDVYVAALEEEAQLSELGVMALQGTITSALANRLRVVEWIRTHPAVADERIESPIVVIGMFRAGTTFLSYLLDEDAENRALLQWESLDSVPPSSPADHRIGDRVDAARASSEMLEMLNRYPSDPPRGG